MIKKLKAYLLTSTIALTMLVPSLGIATVASVSAAANCSGVANGVAEGANAATNASQSLAGGLQSGSGVNCSSSNVSTSSVKTLAARITNVFSIIVGAASIIMIIYGGFRYVISGGESGRVGAAKNSLIYAIVGLVIVALAQLIVHFVLNQTTALGS
ncbi:MAG: pilin [Candidatus Saccharimonadales bacterium]